MVSLSGQVKSLQTGAPIAGATVTGMPLTDGTEFDCHTPRHALKTRTKSDSASALDNILVLTKLNTCCLTRTCSDRSPRRAAARFCGCLARRAGRRRDSPGDAGRDVRRRVAPAAGRSFKPALPSRARRGSSASIAPRQDSLGPVGQMLEEMWDDALWRLKLHAELLDTRRGPKPRARAPPRQRGPS